MSAVEETTSAPLDPGTPGDSATPPALIPVLFVNPPIPRRPSIPVPTDVSTTTTAPEDPGDAGNTQTTTESDVVEDTSTTSTPTRAVPIPESSTTTRRTRTSTLTPTPTPPIPVTSRRTSLPAVTWTTVVRTPSLDPPTVDTTIDVGSEDTAWETSQAATSIPAVVDATSSQNSGDEAAQYVESTDQAYAQSEVLSPFSASSASPASQWTTLGETLKHASITEKSTSPNSAASNQDESQSGMDGSAKTGLVIGVLAAVGIVLLAFLVWRRRAKIAKRRDFLIQQTNPVRHSHNQSDYSWNYPISNWPATADEKSSTKDESTQSTNLSPPPFLPDPLDSTGRSKFTWSIFAPARPPSPTASTSGKMAALRDLRIAIIAPSPASSRADLLGRTNQSSRASSALSGNHLHPLYSYGAHQRPFSTHSRETLATDISPTEEPSPALAELAKRFPIPNQQGSNMNNLMPSEPFSKPLASNNPFRSSTAKADPISRYGAAPQRYSHNSVASNDDSGNPFEFETEIGALDIDFSRIGVTPVHSGHSTDNPTTPVTPVNRRKSTSSLSLYSQEGQGVPHHPFIVEGHPYQSIQGNRQSYQRDSVNEALDMTDKAYRPWSPLGIASGETSRKESFVSTPSGPDPLAWEDEIADNGSRTPKGFNEMLDLYAGRAM